MSSVSCTPSQQRQRQRIGLLLQTWTKVTYVVDQRLKRWQSTPKAWQQLLHKIFKRSTPVTFSVISFEILDGLTMTGLHGVYTHTETE